MEEVTQQHKILSLSLLGFVLMVLFFVGYQLAYKQQYVRYQTVKNREAISLANYKRQIASRETVEQELEALKQDTLSTELLLQETNPALAATAIQQQIKEFVEQNGGNLASVQSMPAVTNEQGFIEVRVRAQFRMYPQHLSKVLYRLESTRPLLMLDTFRITGETQTIRMLAKPGKRPDPPRQVIRLMVDLEVIGYLRAPEEAEGTEEFQL